MRRALITGYGVVSSIGSTREELIDAVQNLRSGVRSTPNGNLDDLNVRIAGGIDDSSIRIDRPDVDRFTAIALQAADDARVTAFFEPATTPERIGVVLGTGLGASATTDAAYERIYRQGNPRLHPLTVPRGMYNAATHAVTAMFGARGPSATQVAACASANQAFAVALQWIRAGLADVVIAGGSDAPLVRGVLRGWEALRVLAPSTGDPASACRPFDRDRAGLVIAEGAAMFIIESEEHARSRGARIDGEIAGAGITSDAGHLTDPSSDGAVRAMHLAIEDAAIGTDGIGYVNAHGTATKANDLAEARAIRECFGDRWKEVRVSSTKSMHGHAMGASGAIELAVSLAALNQSLVPATRNLEVIDEGCELRHVQAPERATVGCFLSNAFGFGGTNCVIAVRTRHGF
jgi:nodulation protein E